MGEDRACFASKPTTLAPYASAAPVASQYGGALAGEVIVDISNPFDPPHTGLVAPDGSSAAPEIAKAAPAGAWVV